MSADLREQVSGFAADITRTVQAVLGDTEVDLTATLLEDRFTVSTSSPSGIELRVEGQPLLQLRVKFECGWDTPGTFMAISRSEFHVLACGDREALFRYEYLRSGTVKGLPGAHLQVHGHRDALTFAMTRAGQRSRRARRRSRTPTPSMSELHFPLGGARFRPPLEDVLHMLVEEFGVDAVDEWQQHLADGRETWRRTQTKACVRDAPDDAAAVLRDLGYTVEPPPGGSPPDSVDRLRSI